jgi:hypothetical protein
MGCGATTGGGAYPPKLTRCRLLAASEPVPTHQSPLARDLLYCLLPGLFPVQFRFRSNPT